LWLRKAAMTKLQASVGFFAVALAIVAPEVAMAHHRHHYRGDYACAERRSDGAVGGTLIGAVAGGLLGNAVDHGRATGTLIGAGAGAYAGHEIGKNSHRC
jgi:uncharacterized protein YcfJ